MQNDSVESFLAHMDARRLVTRLVLRPNGNHYKEINSAVAHLVHAAALELVESTPESWARDATPHATFWTVLTTARRGGKGWTNLTSCTNLVLEDYDHVRMRNSSIKPSGLKHPEGSQYRVFLTGKSPYTHTRHHCAENYPPCSSAPWLGSSQHWHVD